MFEKRQKIYTAKTHGTITEMVRSVIQQIDTDTTLLKIAFFHLPCNNEEYLRNLEDLRKCLEEHYGIENTPLISYIAQKTINNLLTAEVTYIDESPNIIRRNNYILLCNGCAKELITGGIIPKDISASTFIQAKDVFETISQILDTTGFTIDNIYRQWNYIQDITAIKDGNQNYQEFNDARSEFYSHTTWNNGYPAATGIGMSHGGVMVELYACRGIEINAPIDNPMQISAHNYSQKVLEGNIRQNFNHKTTPKFERARIIGNTLYISGTAAIKGELSIACDNTILQAAATMEIMDNLVAKKNIPITNNGSKYDILRVYVKHEKDIQAVRHFMEQNYPAASKQYLVCDICRPELLIEIEGTAHIL